jgi:hypothetical protein
VRGPLSRGLLLLPALALGALAGCGTPPSYEMAKTRDCLKDAGFTVTPPPKSDFVARSATVGAFHAAFPSDANAVTISFGDDAEDADQTSQGYVRFHAKNVGVFDILEVEKNAVLLWKQHPTDVERSQVTDCLK